MLLEKLREYSERLELPPVMYDKVRIKWLIDLDLTGQFCGFVQTEGSGKKNDRGKEYLAPYLGKTSGVKAKLLAENGEYVLGLARDQQKKTKVAQRHQAFIEQIRKCAIATKEPTVEAVLLFLEKNLDLTKLTIPGDLSPVHNLTFRVQGVLPIDLDSVRDYWASVVGGGKEDGAASTQGHMQCLICGRLCNPVKRLDFKIKHIPGGQTSGMAIISANQKAFESYGLEASLIAPTCQSCGEQFSKAANDLIENERTHLTVGPTAYLFWTKEERIFSIASLLSSPEPEEVKALIGSVFGGKVEATELDLTPFYATAFSASGARVAVRDWLDTTVAEVKRHLASYFALQRLVERDGTEGKPLGLNKLAFSLVSSTVRDATKELPVNVPKVLLHVALNGGPLPVWLLFQAVKRNSAERDVTRPRAALIKMVLLSQQNNLNPEDAMIEVDTNNRNPAYLCGRLLALLESVQRSAIPRTNTTITDRFFGTASSAPASVFGRLLRGAQAHLGKLRRDKPGTCDALQRKLEEVQAGLGSFPKVLTLEEQGLFSLGYYHQRAADRAAAIAYKRSQEKETA